MGYRYAWPPKIGDLTPEQIARIELAYQAEQYIQQEQAPDRSGGTAAGRRSLSRSRYDASASRREAFDL